MLTWALALLFAAALVLLDLGTIIIYPFASAEQNPLLAALIGVMLLAVIVAISFGIRIRRGRWNKQSRP